MPKLTIVNSDCKCFLCGEQAFFVSFNSKQFRCVEKITQCPGFVSKAENSRRNNTSKEDRLHHMKKMSEAGNTRLKELHKDKDWRRKKGWNISNSKTSYPLDRRTEWELYENTVDRITRESWIYHNDKINPHGLVRGTDYELDHKYSKIQGFLNNVSPEIIGHYLNLELIPRYANRSKRVKCSITLEELIKACTQ